MGVNPAKIKALLFLKPKHYLNIGLIKLNDCFQNVVLA